MRKRCSHLPPLSSRWRDSLNLKPGGERLFSGCRNRWKVLVAFNGFLSAELPAGQNKNHGNRGDHAAHDNAECATAFVFHDIHPTFAAARCSGAGIRMESAKIVAEFWPFGGSRLHGRQISVAEM